MLRFLIVIILAVITLQSATKANCNFKTGKFFNELKEPKNINSIEINVAKSGKFASNFFRILTSKKDIIPANLKKRFNGTVIVNYNFGKCEFSAKIRQSGDRKDHVKLLDGGKVLRSLDVKLNEGNVIRATRFKLLIPDTRNGVNEVLATLILREAGFISPETFEVPSVINETKSIMIFQEVESKELLERNYRRESAIFKGDESLLWSFKDYKKFALEPLALSIMVNDNWFLKGNSSQEISLRAYSQLQSNYLNYATTIEDRIKGTWGVNLDPNINGSKIFQKFHFSLLAMNGSHGLRPHNRKFYFNPITSDFTPIYYDGDVEFVKLKSLHLGNKLDTLVLSMFEQPLDSSWIQDLEEIIYSKKLKNNFLARVRLPSKEAKNFFNDSINIYSSNIIELAKEIENSSFHSQKITDVKKEKISSYIKFQKTNNVKQKLISDVKMNNEEFIVSYISGDTEILSKEKIADIISKNSLDGERATIINSNFVDTKIDKMVRQISDFPGLVIAAPGIKIDVENDTKSILFTQSNSDDWVLIASAELDNWNLEFQGIKEIHDITSDLKQRFNQFGLTGCFTFYRSKFPGNKINVYGGGCEDSINIIDSKGEIDTIFVDNAHSDALDIDFSEINASEIKISNAGNDCLDVSDGKYEFVSIKLTRCNDKGLSVGEQSILKNTKAKIDNAEIGVSSKDLSAVYLGSAKFNGVKTCIELKHKKQEFGGGYLKVDNLSCDGFNKIDEQSILVLGET